MEADGTSVTVCYHDFVVSVGHTNLDDTVILTNGDGIHTVLARTGILFQQCLLDDTLLGTEQDIMAVDEFRIIQVLDTQVGSHHIIRIDIQQILDSASLRSLVAFRYFVHLQPVTFTFLGEEHHRIMHSCRIDVLNEVFIAGFTTLRPYSTPILRVEFGQRSTLDITQMRNGNNHLIISIEIFRIKFFGSIYNLGTTFVSVFFLYFYQFILDDLFTKFIVGQDFFEVCNLLHQFFIFRMQLVLHQSGQLT